MILAPQLRQSLELLQAPILELQTLIRAEADQNPTLEVIDTVPTEPLEVEPSVQRDRESSRDNGPEPDGEQAGPTSDSDPAPETEQDFSKELDILSRLDREETSYYFQHTSTEEDERRQYRYDSIIQPVSLQAHLMEQLGLSELSAEEQQVGELIVGSIDERGYLVSAPSDLADSAGYNFTEVRKLLNLIQAFDPPGIGATDLRECLLLQLQRMGKESGLEHRIVDQHLNLLAEHKFNQIARRLEVSREQVQEAAQFIATLHPRPGDMFSGGTSQMVVPEITVRCRDGIYIVELNDEHLPKLRISRRYENMLRDENTPVEVKRYIAERIRSANFMISSIGQRQSTLQRIAQEIVRVQTPFFDNGLSGLRPLTMARVAETVGVHETTISRAVAGKFARTPRGVLELKFFFTTAVKKSGGDAVSNKYIQDRIAGMVRDEDSAHPLSDQDLVDRLRENGYRVSRRTVNKYRSILKIPPSHLRRSGR